MRMPVVHGVMDRRILVNDHVDPDVLGPLLPASFRPRIVRGFAMVGVCLIRLRHLRPIGLPWWLGISSENAAHRAAVEWDEHGAVRAGVYVWRRHTNSRLHWLAGGRVFPGIHHHARFVVRETADRYAVVLCSDDGETRLTVRARRTNRLPPSSVFESSAEASAFFQGGSVGYSATSQPSRFHGVELHCFNWAVEPLEVEEVQPSFFENESLFPRGSISFDCALPMRGIDHAWRARSDLCCSEAATAGAGA